MIIVNSWLKQKKMSVFLFLNFFIRYFLQFISSRDFIWTNSAEHINSHTNMQNIIERSGDLENQIQSSFQDTESTSSIHLLHSGLI